MMNPEKSWRKMKGWLSLEKTLKLSRGSDFRVFFNPKNDSIGIIPLKTGIPRRVSEEEWKKFIDKFNQVKKDGYDPFRPGHYAQITYNSSYLVAILKEYGYSE